MIQYRISNSNNILKLKKKILIGPINVWLIRPLRLSRLENLHRELLRVLSMMWKNLDTNSKFLSTTKATTYYYFFNFRILLLFLKWYYLIKRIRRFPSSKRQIRLIFDDERKKMAALFYDEIFKLNPLNPSKVMRANPDLKRSCNMQLCIITYKKILTGDPRRLNMRFHIIFATESCSLKWIGGALLVDGAFETSSSISALRVSLVWAKAPVGVAIYILLRIGAFLQIIIINNNNKIFEIQWWPRRWSFDPAVDNFDITQQVITTKW